MDLKLLLVLALQIIPELTEAASHFCPTRYYVRASKKHVYYERCGGWFRRRRCRRTKTYYVSETRWSAKACCRGWTGVNTCDKPICTSRCSNGGVCSAPYTCRCTAYFTGATCTKPVCNPPCVNGACSAPNKCTCRTGYGGKLCEIAVCSPICGNGGRCTSPGVCSCPATHTGNRCQTPVCRPSCTNGGTCVAPNACRCPLTYSGRICDVPVCTRVCQNGGSCSRPGVCTCPSGYAGTVCETPICTSNCSNGGTCSAPNTCSCTSNYNGTTCANPLPSACNPQCQNGGRCTNINTCACPTTYRGTRCETPVCSPACQNGGQCISPGTCHCLNRYEGTRCESPMCNPSCLNGGQCLSPGACTCSTTFGGSYCQEPICRSKCLNGGVCSSPDICTCPSGFTGAQCQNAVCYPSCLNGGTCERANSCKCPSPYQGDRCDQPVCNPFCLNGGTCVSPNRCRCSSDYKDTYCQTPICQRSCENGGFCVKPNVCLCAGVYTGTSCSTPVCNPACKNGGTCVSPNNCTCLPEFKGFDCDTADCDPPCENGGACTKHNVCTCRGSFSGTLCQTMTDTSQIYGIVGVVLGGLLLLLFIIIVILMCRRRRQKKPMLPERVERFRKNMAKRISRMSYAGGNDNAMSINHMHAGYLPKVMNNSYANNGFAGDTAKLHSTDDDIYVYGDLTTSPDAAWKHTYERLTLGRTIATGHFAVVKQATFRNPKGTQTVAAKILKDAGYEDGAQLMKAKMNFLATDVPPHTNIVNFVGAIPEGPIILFELCDQTLKEWLDQQMKVSDEIMETMIYFSMDIARGMEHLASNQIDHRRLGARNILLKAGSSRSVCKISGFGPMKGDKDDGPNKTRIPMKWMAPEQIGLDEGEKRPYNEKTDVWSYGITVWEIFTKGQKPYSEHGSGDLRGVLRAGYRLPKPDDCPENMYDDVIALAWSTAPKNRPTFAEIKNKLEGEFGGEANRDDYYEDHKEDEELNGYDFVYEDVRSYR